MPPVKIEREDPETAPSRCPPSAISIWEQPVHPCISGEDPNQLFLLITSFPPPSRLSKVVHSFIHLFARSIQSQTCPLSEFSLPSLFYPRIPQTASVCISTAFPRVLYEPTRNKMEKIPELAIILAGLVALIAILALILCLIRRQKSSAGGAFTSLPG